MQLKFERDFFIRPARGSDRNEVVSLVEKLHNPAVAAQLNGNFAAYLGQPELFFRVLLNSNGMLIGVLLAETTRILTLSVNPNFLRREVRDEITHQLKEWAYQKNAGKLFVPKEVVAGDWKAYLKHNGVKVEGAGIAGVEVLEFLAAPQ